MVSLASIAIWLFFSLIVFVIVWLIFSIFLSFIKKSKVSPVLIPVENSTSRINIKLVGLFILIVTVIIMMCGSVSSILDTLY